MKTLSVICLIPAVFFLLSACSVPEQKINLPSENDMRSANEAETNKNGQDTLISVQMQVLEQGNIGSIGLGYLVCALPGQDNEDYKLCFFKEEGRERDFEKPLSEMEFSLEEADYIFPDVRENNVPIGKFIEIYFSDTIVIDADGAEGRAVIAEYNVNDEIYYDTRIYRWDGTGYITDEKLMKELNERYLDIKEYPVEELFNLSSNTDGRSF